MACQPGFRFRFPRCLHSTLFLFSGLNSFSSSNSRCFSLFNGNAMQLSALVSCGSKQVFRGGLGILADFLISWRVLEQGRDCVLYDKVACGGILLGSIANCFWVFCCARILQKLSIRLGLIIEKDVRICLMPTLSNPWLQ